MEARWRMIEGEIEVAVKEVHLRNLMCRKLNITYGVDSCQVVGGAKFFRLPWLRLSARL